MTIAAVIVTRRRTRRVRKARGRDRFRKNAVNRGRDKRTKARGVSKDKRRARDERRSTVSAIVIVPAPVAAFCDLRAPGRARPFQWFGRSRSLTAGFRDGLQFRARRGITTMGSIVRSFLR